MKQYSVVKTGVDAGVIVVGRTALGVLMAQREDELRWSEVVSVQIGGYLRHDSFVVEENFSETINQYVRKRNLWLDK